MISNYLNSFLGANEENFLDFAKTAFIYQFNNVEIYRDYVNNISPTLINKINSITNLSEIPFLPIIAFKNNKIISSEKKYEQIFISSGTTGNQSKHYIASTNLYEKSFTKSFEIFYGDLSKWHILALLPSYIEQDNSSLVYMINNLINRTNSRESAFYLYNHKKLYNTINKLANTDKKILLIGVSYALLDFLQDYKLEQRINNLIIMETGGMKGRREEIDKTSLHNILKQGFKVEHIHSEYGMTELLSQAYSNRDGMFKTPNWMKVIVADLTDPFSEAKSGKTGVIKVLDLANIYSCSFVQTEDIGVQVGDGFFKVLGRLSNADIRGCNLMLGS